MSNALYAPIIAGLVAGAGFVAIFSIDYSMRNYDNFQPVTKREAYLITYPLDTEPENFDCDAWIVDWAEDHNAHFVEIEGYTAAVHGQYLGFRVTDLIPQRAGLAMCTEDYRFDGYGYVSEQALINAVENALEYQRRFSQEPQVSPDLERVPLE